jgi:HAE1 family hydrophobic/amphiphilic exporter-1
MSLEEALAVASENNRDIRTAREFRNKVTGRYVEERAAVLPQVTLSAGASRGWDESQQAFGLPPDNRTVTAQAGLSQVLFTWGQIGAAIRAAKVGVATADDQLRVFRQAVFRDVSAAFYDVLLVKELHAIAVVAKEQRERHLDEARRRFAAGTATDYDVLVAEVALENARPEVIRTENAVRIARERLRFLLAKEDREVDARGSLAVRAGDYPVYEESLKVARGNRPEISDVRHRAEVARELVTIARAGDKPRLDFRAGLGWTEVESGPVDADGKAWSAGLFASWPLFDGFRARGRVAQAESDLAALRIEEARLADSVALQVRNAVHAVREAGEIANGLSGTVAQAERLLKMAEKGYEYGVKTKLDVDDAQANLSQARGNLARAHRDYLVSLVNLDHAKGILGEKPADQPPPDSRWTPAASPLGIVREVLSGEPALSR